MAHSQILEMVSKIPMCIPSFQNDNVMPQAGFAFYENCVYTLGIMISSLYLWDPFYVLTS